MIKLKDFISYLIFVYLFPIIVIIFILLNSYFSIPIEKWWSMGSGEQTREKLMWYAYGHADIPKQFGGRCGEVMLKELLLFVSQHKYKKRHFFSHSTAQLISHVSFIQKGEKKHLHNLNSCNLYILATELFIWQCQNPIYCRLYSQVCYL